MKGRDRSFRGKAPPGARALARARMSVVIDRLIEWVHSGNSEVSLAAVAAMVELDRGGKAKATKRKQAGRKRQKGRKPQKVQRRRVEIVRFPDPTSL